jgi:AcrR family transcriptional regulator
MPSARVDQRREAGQRTRARLLQAALDQLAERGEDGVTLRELTTAAGANVAAVSYHFGSLQALCDAAVEHALERYLDAQQEAVSTLGPDAPLEAVAEAFARPMISAVAGGGRDLAGMRLVARAGIDPPPAWDRLSARFERIRADVAGALKANLPDADDGVLQLRIRCAGGMLNWLALAPASTELRGKTQKKIARLLVPVVAGAFQGSRSA